MSINTYAALDLHLVELRDLCGDQRIPRALRQALRKHIGILQSQVHKQTDNAHVVWSPEDIQTALERRGLRANRGQALIVLRATEQHLTDRSVEQGWEMIELLLDQTADEALESANIPPLAGERATGSLH